MRNEKLQSPPAVHAPQKKLIQAVVPYRLYQQLKAAAQSEHLTISAYLRGILRKVLTEK